MCFDGGEIMAKYYISNSMTDIKNALVDYYGANVTIHSDSTTQIIFSCPQVSDKVIKLTGFSDIRAWFGDAFVGTDITNSVEFGGSTTTGTTSIAHIVCGDSFIIINVLASTLNSRVLIFSQLTNNDFAVLGMIGATSSSYRTSLKSYLTQSNTEFHLASIARDFNLGAKALLFKPLLITSLGALYDENGYISFKEIYTVSKMVGNSNISKGAGYFLTSSDLFEESGEAHQNSLFVEVAN